MKTVIYSLLCLLLFAIPSCNKQSKSKVSIPGYPPSDVSFIDNRTIKYNIMLVACDTCAPIHDIGYRVIISLSAKEDSIIKHISKGQWLSMLNDKKTDFAANLLLYRLYEREAIVLLHYNNAPEWRQAMKENDLHYWQQTLK